MSCRRPQRIPCQTEIEARPDVLVYTSEPMKEDPDVIGNVRATLYAATDGKDTDPSVTSPAPPAASSCP
ncbi:MAG: hypothetical protein IKB16_08545 [Lentisphaeria bacterium]|nr:hypothetical protein [Lentisphaeria bacterium]